MPREVDPVDGDRGHAKPPEKPRYSFQINEPREGSTRYSGGVYVELGHNISRSGVDLCRAGLRRYRWSCYGDGARIVCCLPGVVLDFTDRSKAAAAGLIVSTPTGRENVPRSSQQFPLFAAFPDGRAVDRAINRLREEGTKCLVCSVIVTDADAARRAASAASQLSRWAVRPAAGCAVLFGAGTLALAGLGVINPVAALLQALVMAAMCTVGLRQFRRHCAAACRAEVPRRVPIFVLTATYESREDLDRARVLLEEAGAESVSWTVVKVLPFQSWEDASGLSTRLQLRRSPEFSAA